MLKNASELQKIANNPLDIVAEYARNGAFLLSDADEFFKKSRGWNEEQFNEFKRSQKFQKLNPISYQDFNAMSKAWGDPERHAMFYGNVKAGSGKKMLDVFNTLGANGRTYRKGLPSYAYNNASKLKHLKSFADSPFITTAVGDYDKMYNTMTMLDRYGVQGTDENNFLKGYITPEQYKSYQRWRPLMAIWMNIRGWLRSLFSGDRFSAIPVSHGQYGRSTPAPKPVTQTSTQMPVPAY